MRALIVKLSSMGDIIHTLPAIQEASSKLDIEFDWAIEPEYQDIASWHKNVKQVFTMPIRQWKKNIFSTDTIKAIQSLREHNYDYIIDAQGLLKSALLTKALKGLKCGLDKESAREPFSSIFYDKKIFVDKNQHAILRTKNLFADTFGYRISDDIDYGILHNFNAHEIKDNYIVFLHSTTWQSKHWPEDNWIKLAKYVTDNEYKVLLPWSNDIEQKRAKKISQINKNIMILPKMSIKSMGSILKHAKATVSVDTGLGHLATALNTPTIGLYGPTNTTKNGFWGPKQISLASTRNCAPCLKKVCKFNTQNPPCFDELTPGRIWKQLQHYLKQPVLT